MANKLAVAGYDNDQHAQQNYGSDRDSRWGRSYDSVKAQSFTDEQYARGVQADDDAWAVDYDEWEAKDAASEKHAASAHETSGVVQKEEPHFNKPKGVTDLVNTESISQHGHYLDSFPALPTIP